MIWLRLSFNVITTAVIIWQILFIRKLQRRNRRLHQQLWEEQMRSVQQWMDDMTSRVMARRINSPPTTTVSDATAKMIERIRKDVSAPPTWGADQQLLPPRIAAPSPVQQPVIRDECLGCGRPILKGSPNATWRDHAGRYECDGGISGIKRDQHQPSKGPE